MYMYTHTHTHSTLARAQRRESSDVFPTTGTFHVFKWQQDQSSEKEHQAERLKSILRREVSFLGSDIVAKGSRA